MNKKKFEIIKDKSLTELDNTESSNIKILTVPNNSLITDIEF